MAEGTTLLEVAISRAGILKGARAVEVVVSWATAEASLGHRLGESEGGHLSAAVREYARWWRQSERTAWRELHRFREVFPAETSPARLAEQLHAERERRQLPKVDASIASGLRYA